MWPLLVLNNLNVFPYFKAVYKNSFYFILNTLHTGFFRVAGPILCPPVERIFGGLLQYLTGHRFRCNTSYLSTRDREQVTWGAPLERPTDNKRSTWARGFFSLKWRTADERRRAHAADSDKETRASSSTVGRQTHNTRELQVEQQLVQRVKKLATLVTSSKVKAEPAEGKADLLRPLL